MRRTIADGCGGTLACRPCSAGDDAGSDDAGSNGDPEAGGRTAAFLIPKTNQTLYIGTSYNLLAQAIGASQAAVTDATGTALPCTFDSGSALLSRAPTRLRPPELPTCS